jgi:uncharacterized integral membrane protein
MLPAVRALPVHYERPLAVQVLLAHVVPLVFGAVCGIVVGESKGAYLALNLVAAIGGFLAGLEHETPRDAASRGVAGGAFFGAGIVIAHAIADNHALVKLPHPAVLLILLTAVAGAVLGLLGGALRTRLVRA